MIPVIGRRSHWSPDQAPSVEQLLALYFSARLLNLKSQAFTSQRNQTDWLPISILQKQIFKKLLRGLEWCLIGIIWKSGQHLENLLDRNLGRLPEIKEAREENKLFLAATFYKVSQQNARAMKNLCNCIANVCERKPSD
ncbi:hypothetical protein AV530_002394 [Patagioenas fasciata monilis]|uniref:Uncharacterized protein n=1 Tax=Patagioenas fasciata monilis TaxID=372326 RepID=A0A1V4K7U4_PATFA|nr:hypothetical protein AV530_002394 [Patagioenas fasciata monilis]